MGTGAMPGGEMGYALRPYLVIFFEQVTGFFPGGTPGRGISQIRRAIHCLHNIIYVQISGAPG